MITVDISNVWGRISLSDLLSLEKDISAAHASLIEHSSRHSWMAPGLSEEALEKLDAAARKIRSQCDICLVVGCGAGPKAAIELLQGSSRNTGKGKGDPQILFTGESLSTRQWNHLTASLEGKDISVIVPDTAFASGIAFRSLRWMLERKYGTDAAKERIYAITTSPESSLGQMAAEEGWTCFSSPAGARDVWGTLSPAGLLPMAVAGIDIRELLAGAAEAAENYRLFSFENPVWLYAAVRCLMHRAGSAVEVLSSFEPDLHSFGLWWQRLFAGAEGRNGSGLFPVPAVYPADMPSLGQRIQEGRQDLFETMIRFDAPLQKAAVCSQWKDLDGLGYLEDKTLDTVEAEAWQAAVTAHADAGVPVIAMECGPVDEKTAGELFWFFHLACCISALTLGVDPFGSPCMEAFQADLASRLGKPEAAPQ